MVCKRAVWMQVKAQYEAIDGTSEAAMKDIMDEFK